MREISNARLKKISTGVMSDVLPRDLQSMAKELMRRRIDAGDAPKLCEGCDRKATTSDVEGVPLCTECAKALNNESRGPL